MAKNMKKVKAGGWRRFLRISLIICGIFFFILIFGGMALLDFNPFEGSFGDVTMAIPRSIDFCCRKKNLSEDFTTFPTPVIWDEIGESEAVLNFQEGPTFTRLDQDLGSKRGGGVAKSLADLDKVLEQAPIDLFSNLAANDISIAGLLQGRSLDQANWCAYTLVGWKIKATFGALSYSLVQDNLPPGTTITKEEELFKLGQPGGQVFWVSLVKDLLMIGNDKNLVARSRALALGSSKEDPLGLAADYEDGITNALSTFTGTNAVGREKLKPEEQEALDILVEDLVSIKPFEAYLNTDRIFNHHPEWARWPDPAAVLDLPQRMSSIFLQLKSWRRLAGAVYIQRNPFALALSATINVNREELNDFQKHWVEVKPEPKKLLLDNLAKLAPSRAAAVIGMRMPVQGFLRELFDVLEPSEKEALLKGIRHCGPYGRIEQFLDEFFSGFLPRVGVVVRANDYSYVDGDPVSVDPVPIPAVAIVLSVRARDHHRVKKFIKMMVGQCQRWRFKPPLIFPAGPGGQYGVTEFHNPQISGTGCVALQLEKLRGQRPAEFIISNSSRLVAEMVDAKYMEKDVRPLDQESNWRTIREEIPSSTSGFLYVNGAETASIIQRWRDIWLKGSHGDKASFYEEVLTRYSEQVRREKYPGFSSRQAMPEATRGDFDREVNRRMDMEWERRMVARKRDLAPQINEMVRFFRLFETVHLHLNCSPSKIKVRGRSTFLFR